MIESTKPCGASAGAAVVGIETISGCGINEVGKLSFDGTGAGAETSDIGAEGISVGAISGAFIVP
jgi:hypothetical protein